jgi:WD40 repeat protein
MRMVGGVVAASAASTSASASAAASAAAAASTTGSLFDACAATAAFFLFAQRNVILCLHHDTLAIERRFTGHRADVLWIEVDNHSEHGAGRLVASYDTHQMTIVWDLLTGEQVTRVEPYEDILVAAWMRNGIVAFGRWFSRIAYVYAALLDSHHWQGIPMEASRFSTRLRRKTCLSELSTIESLHLRPLRIAERLLLGIAYFPSDFASVLTRYSYMNGTILIVTLKPTFTILHTLNTQRAPSTINFLAWHGSSSKQKSDMLGSQTVDGDLRVWSIPKALGESPSVIRSFQHSVSEKIAGPCWFAWSKQGRIVQYAEG